ncbi:hypothetical protein BB559_003561 [Furculomyces boomerangus]|uniref:Glutathione hydrolase n=2 Tax=Harpellales TaxID=61421 RepID=A0A2T9YKL9_9FUNG|nr:hypothetical protein BB559_003561 [Furculomyces boomerangus]PVZ99362.1 hypothetical protein BB558_004630 [Smittium angustum]
MTNSKYKQKAMSSPKEKEVLIISIDDTDNELVIGSERESESTGNKGILLLMFLSACAMFAVYTSTKCNNSPEFNETIFKNGEPAFLMQEEEFEYDYDQVYLKNSIEDMDVPSNYNEFFAPNDQTEGNPDAPKGGVFINSKESFGKHGAVAADEARCSEIGVNVLRDGGSAVDAAISTAVCIGLFNSFSSGIGGGGFMLVRKPNGESELIDFREVAPTLAEKLMFSKNITKAQVGGLAIAVPGEVRGYGEAHKRFGRVPWKRLFEPTIKYARDGYTIGKMLGIHLNNMKNKLKVLEGFKDVFFNPDGSVKKEGELAKRENFANTLSRIAKEGPDAFYKSDITESMVNTIKRNGGIITTEDFQKYKPVIRKPSVFTYHDRKIIAGSPPTSGTIFGSVFNILEGYDLKDSNKRALSIHRIIEAFKFGYAQRTSIADPDFVDDGMAVSFTSTVNLLFGSQVMDPVTGVIFNDHMDDFSTPKIKNAFGLYPSPRNYIVPGKRPLSTTSAVIVEKNGVVEFVLGASGGSRILTSTAQTLINSMEFNLTLKQAIDSPRVHHQLLPEELLVEPFYPKKILKELKTKGHKFGYMNQGTSVVQGIHKLGNGIIHAVSDGRKFGAPDAY